MKLLFQCKSCGQQKDRSGFHTDKRARFGIKVGRCKSCYAESTGKDRQPVPLTAQESKLLRRWLACPTSGLYTTHRWGYDPVMPRFGVKEKT